MGLASAMLQLGKSKEKKTVAVAGSLRGSVRLLDFRSLGTIDLASRTDRTGAHRATHFTSLTLNLCCVASGRPSAASLNLSRLFAPPQIHDRAERAESRT